MPSGINYSRVNAGGVNSGYDIGPDSFSDLLYEQPATQIRRTTNLASTPPLIPVGVRKNAAMDLAGFSDPFDELAATTAKPRSSTPQLAPDSSHSPLALDPLADLWQGDNQADLLEGINSQPPSHQPTTGGHCTQPNNQHDPWDLDIFGVPPPAAPLQRQSADNVNPRPRPHHTGPSSSTGDLLNLGNGDLACGDPHSSSHVGRSRTSPSLAAEGGDSRQQNQQGQGGPKEGNPQTGMALPGDEGSGTGTEQRELFIYALPLSKEKLVFLPITGWQEEPKPPPAGVAGSLSNGLNKLQDKVTTMWTNMGNKDQSTIQHKIYQHGQAVIENMSAEERLMKYIPKAATKVVVYHPASIMPTEVQDQLQKLTSNFMVKATGKAAAAGLLLPVAVGIEMIAVPGTGWYALYQLYKSSVTVTGVNRLSQYLKHANNVRVCYAGMEKLDLYVERAKLSPDGLLTQDDVDDLCHELEEPGLHHPLTELRTRYLKRVQQKTGDYALLPANDAVDMEGRSGQADPQPKGQPKGLGAKLAFWK